MWAGRQALMVMCKNISKCDTKHVCSMQDSVCLCMTPEQLLVVQRLDLHARIFLCGKKYPFWGDSYHCQILKADVYSTLMCSGVPQHVELLLYLYPQSLQYQFIYFFFKSSLAAIVCRNTQSTSDDKKRR